MHETVLLALGVALVLGWRATAGRFRRLLPPQRLRAVPWSGVEVWIALLLVLMVWRILVHRFLLRSGFFTAVYGPDFPLEVPAEGAGAVDPIAMARRMLWVTALAFPLEVSSVLCLLALGSRTQMYQLGLTSARLGRNVLLGVLGWLLLVPVVFGLNLVVNLLYLEYAGLKPEEHPLTRLAESNPLAIERVLIVFSAVVAAPILEELLFRGVLQRWFIQRPLGGRIALAGAFGVALIERTQNLEQSLSRNDLIGFIHAVSPAAFVVALTPVYFALERTDRLEMLPRRAATGIFGASLLFAAFHSAVWPSPVSLFVLALGLGWLAYRTQSLVGPIVLHALFNAISCIVLLCPQFDLEKGKAQTSAASRLAAVSTSTMVPGSQWPRRR